MLISGTLTNAKTIRIEPPLVIEYDEIDEVLNRLEDTLKAVSGAPVTGDVLQFPVAGRRSHRAWQRTAMRRSMRTAHVSRRTKRAPRVVEERRDGVGSDSPRVTDVAEEIEAAVGATALRVL